MTTPATTAIPSILTSSPIASARFSDVALPEVSIIIVTYGTGRIVIDALDALAAGISGTDGGVEVIVVDNPHPTLGHLASDRVLLSTSGIRVVRPASNLGFGGGNELGVTLARADTICLLNPDVIVADGWLSTLLTASRANPDHIVAPRLLAADGTLDEAGQRIDRHGKTHPIHDGAEIDYASAACWVLRRSLFELVGGFDPAYHPAYYEDIDFAFRVARAGGGTIVHPDVSLVHHRGSGSTHDRASLERQLDVFRTRWADEIRRRTSSWV